MPSALQKAGHLLRSSWRPQYQVTKLSKDEAASAAVEVRPLVYLIVPTGLVYAFRWALGDKGLSQHMLIGLQLVRPIGLVFVLGRILRGDS